MRLLGILATLAAQVVGVLLFLVAMALLMSAASL